MKITKLLIFLALLGYCFSDECEDEFQQLIKNQCEKIDNSCSFFDLRCISKKDNDCSRGDDDPTTCSKIFHKDFPTKKCVYNSQKCEPANTVCSDFNYPFSGVSFVPLIDRSYCDGFSASTDRKRCLISNDGRTCQEHFRSCDGLSDPDCTGNLISYKRECKMVGGTCTEVGRNCDNPLYNVNEEECRTLNPTNANQKCVYTNGECTAEFISCVNHDSTDCNNKRPLIQNGNEYDLSKKCIYNTPSIGTGSCEEEKEDCSLYTGDDKTVCQNLKVSDPTKKRCVYDPTSTSLICKEEYKTCQLYNDMETSKTREDCESISLENSNKKCIYINEIDKCIETELFTTCEEYKGIDKYICESIINPTNHTKCYLEKDRTCKERMFNCTEVTNEEDCLHYAKPVNSRKICVYSSGRCYEEYQRCEDYLSIEETETCSGLTMHNGKKCYEDPVTGLCRTKNKTCFEARTDKDECNLIAQSGVSDPDKKVCQYIGSSCQENYKYCSDYREGNNSTCIKIEPYDDSGNKIDRAFQCIIQDSEVGCEKISKSCTDAGSDPILCSLISPNIRDNNIKYCAFIDNDCKEQYKACENITSSVSDFNYKCRNNIPLNYLTKHCKVNSDGDKCISKKTCEEFSITNDNNNKYLCENITNCTYSSSGVCEKKVKTCEEVEFYTLSDKNEEICQNIETNDPYTKCALKEDKTGCEEIVVKSAPNNTTQESSSEFLTKGIQYLIIFLCLFI